MRPSSVQPSNVGPRKTLRERFAGSNIVRVLSYRDFRLLWIGAFVSFTGSWVQNVAQGDFVYVLTRDESKLAFVSFCGSIPVFLFGLMAGGLADVWDKRKVLVWTQALFAAGAIFLAVATHFGFVQYWMLPSTALFLGLVSCAEMPARQSIVSRVVPPEDLPAAVPVQAMTFNVARIFGPALGGLMLQYVGVAACYLVNGLSFLALIYNGLAIKADLRAEQREPQPLRDLVAEGMLYTFRDRRLKTLLILESITAVFGIAYIPLMPAYVHEELHMNPYRVGDQVIDPAKQIQGYAFTAIGLGALFGLLLITQLNQPRHRATTIRISMWAIGTGLVGLSYAGTPWAAYPFLTLIGAATICQFNSTNALFQILSPARLRGRVLAMHIWALNGLSPFGVLFFGWLAARTRHSDRFEAFGLTLRVPSVGVDIVMQAGALAVLLAALVATFMPTGLNELEADAPTDDATRYGV